VERLADHLERHPGLDLADVAWTLQAGRAAHPVRRHVVASSVAGAVSALRAGPTATGPAPADGAGASDGVVRPGRMRRPRPVFAFADPGAEPVTGSVAALYRTDGTFRGLLDELDDARRGHGGDDLHRLLLDGPGAPGAPLPVDALVAVQYATARLLISWGVRPAVVTGTGAGARTALALATTSTGTAAARVLFGADPGGTGTGAGGPGPGVDRPVLRETGPALDDTPEAAVVHIGPGRPAGQPGPPPADVLDHPGAPAPGVRGLLDVVGRIWSAGAPVDLAALHRGTRRRRLRLPTYPFERRSYLVPHGSRPSTRTPTGGERLP
jgi:phthiocerol/phenolphthiocerol synthesis type-I polyketide synthase E